MSSNLSAQAAAPRVFELKVLSTTKYNNLAFLFLEFSMRQVLWNVYSVLTQLLKDTAGWTQ